jgi:polyhydroxyalkanoate synthase
MMAGRRADLREIRCPVLAVGAKEDNIAPPACVKPLIDAVSTRDKEYVELPGGHISLIAGRGASVHCWPKVASWLAARS